MPAPHQTPAACGEGSSSYYPGAEEPQHAEGGLRGWASSHRRALLWGGVAAAVVAVLLVILLPVLLLTGKEEQPMVTEFVRVGPASQQLEVGCAPYHVVGGNAWDLTEVASVESYMPGQPTGREIVKGSLESAVGIGLNTVRVWAHTSNPQMPFQVLPGLYDESGLAALDFVVATASKLGLRVILSLTDNWKYYNGVDQYVDWSTSVAPRPVEFPPPGQQSGDPKPAEIRGAGATPSNESVAILEKASYERARHAQFWTDPGCRQMYRKHASAITGRRNSITGRVYRNDATILAWDLVNEPRCEGVPNCAAALQAWLEEMAPYVKSLAPRQLLTIGSEGFFGRSTPELLSFNPGPWAADTGQDFVLNNQIDAIDFATIHTWTDQWGLGPGPFKAFLEGWLSSHIYHAQYLDPTPTTRPPTGAASLPADATTPAAAGNQTSTNATQPGSANATLPAASSNQTAGITSQAGTTNQTTSNVTQPRSTNATQPASSNTTVPAPGSNQTAGSAPRPEMANATAPAPGSKQPAGNQTAGSSPQPGTANATVPAASVSASQPGRRLLATSPLINSIRPPAVHKPLLLEEFGQLLSESDAAQVQALRDPVYVLTYDLAQQYMIQQPAQLPQACQGGNYTVRLATDATEAAVAPDASGATATAPNYMPLVGTLFWKWLTPVPTFIPDEYGVTANSSTAAIIGAHAAVVYAYDDAIEASCGACAAGADAA
ncbi:hypothetical protein FOA52_015894 [Chlamydomonas sp. UWO 241]|nr:hypothetical protein FOA52_015894 [Chlamydomonas sp. UWO 241]